MRLYEIVEAIEQISEMVDEDGVLLPEAEELFDKLVMDKEEKFRNIGALIKNLNSDIAQCKLEKQQLSAKQSSAENKVERLKSYLKLIMDKSNSKDYKAGVFSFKIQEFASVVVDDVEKLPEEFKKITVEAKKTELANAMKLGTKIEGVSIVKNPSLVIR